MENPPTRRNLKSILICEDEALLAKDMEHSVRGMGYEVVGPVGTGEAAIQLCRENRPDLVLMDIKLKGEMDGIEAAGEIRKSADIPVIYITAYSMAELMDRIKSTKPYGYLTKPVNVPELSNAINLAIYKHDADIRVRRSEERYRRILDNYPWGALFLFDKDLRYNHCGGAGLLEVGLDPAEIIGKTPFEVFPEDVAQVAERHCLKVFEGVSSDYIVSYKNRLYQNRAVPLIRDDGVIEEGIVFTLEITEYNQVKEELESANRILKESEKQKRDILNAIGEMVAYQDREGRIIWANRVSGESINETTESIIGRHCFEIWHNRTERCLDCPPERAFETGKVEAGEIQTPDGRYWRLKGYPVRNEAGVIEGIVEIGREITAEKEASAIIKASLEEKEALLREIHHRVKNNLAIISSILNIQSEMAADDVHMEMFKKCQHRIRSMAMAHELLYSSENIANIRAPEYIESLLEHLIMAYSAIGSEVEVRKDIEDVAFGLDIAIPLGLILTELISNAFQHGLKHTTNGILSISLAAISDNEMELQVRDNGVGATEAPDLLNIGTVGLGLVSVLTEQLAGSLELANEQGFKAIIRFKVKSPDDV